MHGRYWFLPGTGDTWRLHGGGRPRIFEPDRTIFMTNFVSNVVSMLLFFGLVIPVIAGTAVSSVGVAIIICIVANFASLVPSAAVTAPLFFGPEHITVKNTLPWNLIMIAAAFLVSMLVLFPLGNAALPLI